MKFSHWRQRRAGPKKYLPLPMEREIFGWMDFSGVSRIPRGHWTTCSCHSHGGRERQVFIQDFRIKKNTNTSRAGFANKIADRSEFCCSLVWNGIGNEFMIAPTNQRFDQLRVSFGPSQECGYLLEDHWEKIVWHNLVCRPHREHFTDARGRGDSRGSETLGGVLLASGCESSDGVMGHHSFDACPVNHASERFLPSERERRINDAGDSGHFRGTLISHDLTV